MFISLGAMNLTQYIDKSLSSTINCYDQAGGVSTFGSLLGVSVNFEFKQPFGFITPIDLIGIPGKCNNPFFTGNKIPQLVPMNFPYRTYFGNHAYVDFKNNIYYACGGPVRGISKFLYFGNVIDQSRTISLPYRLDNSPVPKVK